MKKFSSALLWVLVACTSVFAQNFEGTIRYSMKVQVTDPAKKQEMDNDMQKINSPETQAAMQQMQEKMNDPEFKEQMAKNPQLKAQMEQMMAMMQGAQQSASGAHGAEDLMPKGMLIKVKNQNVLSKIEGGMSASMMGGGEFLYRKDKDESYTINRTNKTYSVVPKGKPETTPTKTYKVTKTSETMKIMGYNCTKYVVESEEHGVKNTQFIWASTEVKEFDASTMANVKFGRSQNNYMKEISGCPVRMEINTKEAKVIIELIEIKKETLSASDFEIPAGYTATQGLGR